MNWALLLSKYTRSILQDEQPLLMLSLLERAGLATETELAQMMSCDESQVKTLLSQLYQDELLDYGSSHVRLTNKGREILERLALHHEILKDVLDTLAFKGQDRDDFAWLLEAYRRTSFRLYLNSLCTLRQWKVLSRQLPSSRETSRGGAEILAGMRSLLLRDLRNWIVHMRPPESDLNKIGETIRHIILCDTDREQDLYREADHTHNCSVYLLLILSETKTEAPVPSDKWTECMKIRPLIRAFHDFQASWQPDIWFDKWVAQLKLPNPRRYRNSSRYLISVGEALQECHGSVADRQAHEDSMLQFWQTWAPSALGSSFFANFFSDLLTSDTIEQLEQLSGMPMASLKILVSNIHDACSRLLKAEPKTQAQNEGSQ